MNRWILAGLLLSIGALADDRDPRVVAVTSGVSAVYGSELKQGVTYSVQCTFTTGGARYKTCAVLAGCAANTDDWLIPAAGMNLPLKDRRFIAFYGDGGSGTCRIYDYLPQPKD
jgi:hypothetical protein